MSNRDHAIVQLNQFFSDLATPTFDEEKLTIAEAKNLVRSMAKDRENCLDSALDCLMQLTSKEVEFPTAISLILNKYNVNQSELTMVYDKQNN